jgi:Uma2 family endonuclease
VVTATVARSASQPIVDYPLFRLSVVQYERMVEVGILHSGDPIELLEGLLVQKMTQHPPHATASGLLLEAIRSLLPAGWHAREQKPIRLEDSEPEPDAAVVRGNWAQYANSHPSPEDIGLVVEVADSSLGADRTDKGRIYARARLPAYWIVNLVDGQIEVYSRPRRGKEPSYRTRLVFGLDDSVPLELDGQQVGLIPVRDILAFLAPQ